MNYKLSQILNLSYPGAVSGKDILRSSFIIAIAVYLFLIVYQPFGTYSYNVPNKYLLLIPYALIMFIVFCIANFFWRSTAIHNRLWQEIIKMPFILTACSFFNYIYSIYFINHTTFTAKGFVYMFIYTLAIGIPVSITYYLTRYALIRKKREHTGPPVQDVPPNMGKAILTITPTAEKTTLEFIEDDFLYARSEGNYCAVFYMQHEELTKKLLRITLRELEKQLGSEAICRCHRSYVINKAKITKSKGNAQGYKLNVLHIEGTIPVSRKYISIVKDL